MSKIINSLVFVAIVTAGLMVIAAATNQGFEKQARYEMENSQ